MKTLILIPARGGSTRIKRKNLQKVGGKTLVELAVERCKMSGFLAHLALGPVVITDDDEIAAEALRCKAQVLRNHPGDGPSAAVVEAALGVMPDVEACVLVQCTSPLAPWMGVLDVMTAILGGAARAVTVDPATGKRTGSAYGATRLSWLGMGDCKPQDIWQHALLIPSDDGPDVNTPEDLQKARDMYEMQKAREGGRVGKA